MMAGLHVDPPAWLAALEHPSLGPDAGDEARMAWVAEVLERQIAERSGGPFAAALLDGDGTVLAVAVNRVEPASVCIAHAEVLALAEAGIAIGSYTFAGRNATLVTTTEPCAMCLGAVAWSGVDHLVCGAFAADAEAIGFDEGDKPTDWVDLLEARGVRVARGVRQPAIRALMERYLAVGGDIYNG